jgi:hypothetical protein
MLLAGASTTAFLVGVSLRHLDDAGNGRNSLDHPLPELMQRVVTPRIAISPVIIAEARSQISLEIQIGTADKVRDSNLLLLRGLPSDISFSEGLPTGLGAWAVPVGRLTGLKMNVTAGVSSSSVITLSLVETDGTVLAVARATLVIVPERSNLSADSAVVEESPPEAAAPPEQRGGEVGSKVATLSLLERARAEQLVVHGEQRKVELGNIIAMLNPLPGTFQPSELIGINLTSEAIAKIRILGVTPIATAARGVTRLVLQPSLQTMAALSTLRSELPGEVLYPNYIYRPFDYNLPSGPVVDSAVSRRTGKCSAERCYGVALVKWQTQLAACAEKVKIGVIDTGFDFDHLAFQKLKYHHAIAASKAERSSNWHGTAVLSLLAGDANSGTPGLLPNAEFVIADTFFRENGGESITDTVSLMSALDLMEQFQVRVVNMSLAGPSDPAIRAKIQSMNAKGVVFIAAAGNFGPLAPPVYPAAYEEVIAVTAVDRDGKGYAKANHGKYIDVAAPGVDVWTAFPGNKEGAQSGTSFAVPFVTAIAAAIYGTAKPAQPVGGIVDAKRALLSHMVTADLGEKGRDLIYGLGLVQAPKTCAAAPSQAEPGELSWVPPMQQSPVVHSIPAAQDTWAATVKHVTYQRD